MSHGTDELSCAAARERLDEYLDGDLAESGRRRLERHLAICAACAAELRLAGEVLRELRALPELDCPPRVLERAARLAGRAGREGGAMSASPPAAAPPARVEPLAPLISLAKRAPWRAPATGRRAREPRPERTVAGRVLGGWRRSVAGVAALLLLALTASLAGSGGRRPDAVEVARGAAQVRFALAYVGRVSERAGWRLQRQVLARRVVAPLTENLAQALSEALRERRGAVQSAAQALRREARKET
jgi:anti-sigma factor RsiW